MKKKNQFIWSSVCELLNNTCPEYLNEIYKLRKLKIPVRYCS